ncbi:MAG: hypothetical protein KGI36_21250, partial [Burkholderiales bacterium]|nr:hypothetical protein [Burkholderiales bacterium]
MLTLAATALAIARAAAASDARALAAAMKQALRSDGFELRVALRDPADAAATPARVAIVGEFDA